MARKSIEEVLEEYRRGWMSIPGVMGTGIGERDGEPCIRVLVVKVTPELKKKIPSELEGFVVDIEGSGPFRALSAED